jgi:hypothetical protein
MLLLLVGSLTRDLVVGVLEGSTLRVSSTPHDFHCKCDTCFRCGSFGRHNASRE